MIFILQPIQLCARNFPATLSPVSHLCVITSRDKGTIVFMHSAFGKSAHTPVINDIMDSRYVPCRMLMCTY